MSVIRLRGAEPEGWRSWRIGSFRHGRGYSDPAAFIFAETEGTPHNTITPIARRRARTMSWIWCCGTILPPRSIPWAISTPTVRNTISKRRISDSLRSWPCGIAQPLKERAAGTEGSDPCGSRPAGGPGAGKACGLGGPVKKQYTFTQENTMEILMRETGRVFSEVLEVPAFISAPGGTAGVRALCGCGKQKVIIVVGCCKEFCGGPRFPLTNMRKCSMMHFVHFVN